MNKIKYICLSLLALGAFTSCVHDLNVEPKDPNIRNQFEQDALFTKIYATFGTTGQKGPDGEGDVDGIDEGASSFYRMAWELNEFPSDGGWWQWGDAGIAPLRIMNWNSSNTLVAGVYYRYLFDITLCNLFLDKTIDKSDDKTNFQRAEVRLIRAINYYNLLDMFGRPAFVISFENPDHKQIERKELFAWLETELKELVDLLPADKISFYRFDKVGAEFMLMRLYLNAEVYTGEARWDDAANYAAKVMQSKYQLATAASNGYSAYEKLFMADNNTNGSEQEAVFMIAQDGLMVQCWGGSKFLVSAPRDSKTLPFGISDTWSCWRSSPELIAKFVDLETAKTIKGHEREIPALLGDDRALFFSYYVVPETGDVVEHSLNGPMTEGFHHSWAIHKWTAIHSDGREGSSPDWPDTDIPLFRVAEAYLSYAEAVYRGGNAVNGSAEAAITAIRNRANNTQPFTINDDFLLDEWAREFFDEGRRRIDLVRFGQFAGDKCTRHWEGRGGKPSGASPVKLGGHLNVFPIPEAEIVANDGKITQNEGY